MVKEFYSEQLSLVFQNIINYEETCVHLVNAPSKVWLPKGTNYFKVGTE